MLGMKSIENNTDRDTIWIEMPAMENILWFIFIFMHVTSFLSFMG